MNLETAFQPLHVRTNNIGISADRRSRFDLGLFIAAADRHDSSAATTISSLAEIKKLNQGE
jgi:hypothetical protein